MTVFVLAGQSVTSAISNTQRKVVLLQGRPRYVLLVGDPGGGVHNSGYAFQSAAETEATNLRSQGAVVEIVRVSTIQQFNAAIGSGKAIKAVYFFGHGSVGAVHVGQATGADTNIDMTNVSQLRAGMMLPDAPLYLYACNTARKVGAYSNIADSVAYYLNRPTYGFSSGLHFQNDPEYRKAPPYIAPLANSPMYMRPDDGNPATKYEAQNRR